MTREMQTYYVDREMCGDVPKSFDLKDFCDVLQAVLDTTGRNIAIEAVLGSENGAWNEDPHLVSNDIFFDALCTYCDELDAQETRCPPPAHEAMVVELRMDAGTYTAIVKALKRSGALSGWALARTFQECAQPVPIPQDAAAGFTTCLPSID